MAKNRFEFVRGVDGVMATLVTPKGVSAGWRYDGEQMRHRTGQVLRFSSAVSTRLATAQAQCTAPQWVVKTGDEMSEQDRAHKWEFLGVTGDVQGQYGRLVSQGERTVVEFDGADVVK